MVVELRTGTIQMRLLLFALIFCWINFCRFRYIHHSKVILLLYFYSNETVTDSRQPTIFYQNLANVFDLNE